MIVTAVLPEFPSVTEVPPEIDADGVGMIPFASRSASRLLKPSSLSFRFWIPLLSPARIAAFTAAIVSAAVHG